MSDSLKRAKQFYREIITLCKKYNMTVNVTDKPKLDMYFQDEHSGTIWTMDQLATENILEKVKNWSD